MRTILIGLLLLACSFGASGQMVIDSYRFAPTEQLLLDEYPTAAAAYSLRKLRTAYTGDAIVVRRSSDDALDTIGFVGNYLDTATMKTFCGANNCFVRVWYDQSSNNRNFEQTTNGSQPQIIASGTVLYDNGEVALRFDGSNDWMEIPSSTAMFNFIHNGEDATIFSVQRFGVVSDPNAAYTFLDNTAAATGNIGFWLAYEDRTTVSANNAHRIIVARGSGGATIESTNSDIITPNVVTVLYSKFDADNATAANRFRGGVNGGADYGNNTLTNAPSVSNATYNLTLGTTGNPASRILRLLGAVQELIIYNANQSANRTAIETNINNFYNIY